MSTIEKLQNWYASQCDGDWEHNERIRLTTLDNPGWGIDINLKGTRIPAQSFTFKKVERTEHDWCHCFLEDHVFKIRCGPRNLGEALEVFLEWVAQK